MPESIRRPTNNGMRKASTGQSKRKREDIQQDEDNDDKDLNLPKSFMKKLLQKVKQALGKSDAKKQDATKLPPFSICTSKTDYTVYQLKNPFVDIVEAPGVEFVDALDKAQLARNEPMDADALRAVMDDVNTYILESKRVCPQARTELGYRDIHISLLKPMVRFTIPAKPTVKTSFRTRHQKRQKLTDDLGNEGLYLCMELVGDTDPMDLKMRYEGDGETPSTSSDRFDIRIMVYDSRIKEGDNLVTVAYVECKNHDEDLVESIFQAATYARTAAMENMKRCRYSPIFLQGFAKTKWKHGMLVPSGTVRVENGKIDSVESIHEGDTRVELNEVLKDATSELRAAYPGYKTYPNGTYLSGVLYVDKDSVYPLPLQSGELDDAFFYQTWLQIIAGNEARKWKLEDVQSRQKMNRDLIVREYDKYKRGTSQSRVLPTSKVCPMGSKELDNGSVI